MTIQEIDGKMAWYIVTGYINDNGFFVSVRGNKYPCRCTSENIYYIGEKRNGGEEEDISKEDFIAAFNVIKILNNINTNSIKELLPTKVYRKRTPLIGLLSSAAILK